MLMRSLRRIKDRGFTLIELMVVISIILILMAIAIPIYQKSVEHARESALKQDLATLRSAIDQFTLDKEKAPQSLDELVSAGYLRQIPKDPITDSNSTWQAVQDENVIASPDQDQGGIIDVHSGAPGTSSDGTAFNTW
jgi:general secretion pathway protein G